MIKLSATNLRSGGLSIELSEFFSLQIIMILCTLFQAIRELEEEIETTRNTMVANTGTREVLEKQLLEYRGTL